MFIILFVIPLTSILFNLLFLFNPPKERSIFAGYRTKRSMKSQLAWDYSQKFSSKILTIIDATTLAATAITLLILAKAVIDFKKAYLIIILIQLSILFLASIVPTEIALMIKFDKDGNPK